MPAPVRVKFSFANSKVSAFYLGDTGDVVPVEPVCKSCAPLKTKMLTTHQFTINRRGKDQCITIYKCTVCKRQWAVGWSNSNVRSEAV